MSCLDTIHTLIHFTENAPGTDLIWKDIYSNMILWLFANLFHTLIATDNDESSIASLAAIFFRKP